MSVLIGWVVRTPKDTTAAKYAASKSATECDVMLKFDLVAAVLGNTQSDYHIVVGHMLVE